MKMKDIENIRRIEVLAPIVLEIMSKTSSVGGNDDLMAAAAIIDLLYLGDVLLSSETSKLTSDYKELSTLYSEVIDRTANLTEDFELTDPREIFAFYVYLSHDKYFEYDINLKDFPNMQGIDVVRGVGVCRSISSMLTDIYTRLGFDSSNLLVYTTVDGCRKQQKLCDTPLKKNVDTGKFTDLVIKITSKIELGNHQITLVKENDKRYILDPTNDGILSYNSDKKILYVGEEENYMKLKRASQFLVPLIIGGNTKYKIDSLETDVNLEEYREIYLRTLKLCKENIYEIMKFYEANKEIYDDIFRLMEEQKGLFRRMIPIIPKINIKGAEKLKKLTN